MRKLVDEEENGMDIDKRCRGLKVSFKFDRNMMGPDKLKEMFSIYCNLYFIKFNPIKFGKMRGILQ